MSRWFILVHRIPPRPPYLRAKMLQRLTAVGAVALKNSVYLLPHRGDPLEDFQWIAQEIVAGGGDAHLFEGDFVDGAASEAAVLQFRAVRNGDYDTIAADAHAALKAARSAAALAELAAVHARLMRRMEEVRTIDFFDSERSAAAEKALAAIEKKLRSSAKEGSRMVRVNSELRGRTWVTRPGVKIDRMASAWFIRRFIDPKARFRYVDAAESGREGEVRFDMVGGEFTHEGERCTFETLVARIGLKDKAVRVIAEIVHDLDLKDAKFGRAEGAGVRMLLEGLMARTAGDDERIERALVIFDDLHEALGSRTGRSRK